MPPCTTTTFGFYAAKRWAAKNPVMKARVPIKERPRRLMLSGANIDSCRFRKPIVDA
jgi:hypothetical protein